ncbi:MAG: hypothetical protein Q8O15_00945 [Rectinemataceae bacterium]|nr:hypothetical protein [Rectinemataceae bacterium]
MMKEEILEEASAAARPEEKRQILKEAIQAAVLRSLHESGAFASLCLTGAAARHFTCAAPEASAPAPAAALSDLEFCLVDKKGYKPEQWLFAAKRRLRFMGFDARIAFARKLAKHVGWIKLPGLLEEAGIAEGGKEALGFGIVIDIAPGEKKDCRVSLVEAQGECFALRWR